MTINSIFILMVEDALVTQIAEATVLENMGCEVHVSSTGKEAIMKTKQAPDYDLILLDLGLPDIDALTVTEEMIKNYKEKGKNPPPIIALTAHDCSSFQQESIKAGMLDFLTKPLTEEMAKHLFKQYVSKT